METAAKQLHFERAAALRDRIALLRGEAIDILGIQADDDVANASAGKKGAVKRVRLVGETRKRIERENRKKK